MKLLAEYIQESLHGLEAADFLERIQKAVTTKMKTWQIGRFHNHIHLPSSKVNAAYIERQVTDRKEIFTVHVSDREVISRIQNS